MKDERLEERNNSSSAELWNNLAPSRILPVITAIEIDSPSLTQRQHFRSLLEPSPSAPVLAGASLPPPHIYPDPSVPWPGYSCSSGSRDAPCPEPSPSAPVPAGASLPP